jgi:biotin carboxylase/2-polyprenyl-3-methyl-5-hydroxy-6-metoxy-1,4-benzoquinol methylase
MDERRYFVIVDPHAALYRYLEIVHRKGYRTLVLASDAADCRKQESIYNEETGKPDVSGIDTLVECDVANASAIVRALEPHRDIVAGLLPGNETSVAAAFEAVGILGTPRARPGDATCLQIKNIMKERLAEWNVPTPRFHVARTFEQALNAWQEFGRDCMVKMVDFVSSANVFRVTTEEQLRGAWDSIIFNKLSLRTPMELQSLAILEEFVGGRELSAEGYVTDEGVVVLNHCEKVTSDHFVVIGHFVPAAITSEEARALDQVARQCVAALGFRNSAFHIEIHMRDGQPYVIECAARPPGQHISGLIQQAYGFDLLDINIDLATGQAVNVQPRDPDEYFALLTLYAEKSGTFSEVAGVDELRRAGVLRHHHVGVPPGTRVEALTNFRHRYGFVVLAARSMDILQEKATWAVENVRLKTTAEEPGNGSAHQKEHAMSVYDHTDHATFQRHHQRPTRLYAESYSFFRMLGPVDGQDVLDLACGEGWYTRQIKQRGAARVMGADVADHMISMAKHANISHDLGIEYIEADAANLGKVGDFDAVVATLLFHYAATEEQFRGMCDTIWKNLKPGGRFVGICLNPFADRSDPAHQKYGITFDKQGALSDGDALSGTIHLNDPQHTVLRISHHYWTHRAYERNLRLEGFEQISWKLFDVSPDGINKLGRDWWTDFLNNPYLIGLTCVRPFSRG